MDNRHKNTWLFQVVISTLSFVQLAQNTTDWIADKEGEFILYPVLDGG